MTTKSWDDIDLGGLSMESSSTSGEDSHSPRQERISAKDIAKILLEQGETMQIKIQNLASNKDFVGIILDISPGGVKVLAREKCLEADVLRISLAVGKRLILCRAKVCWSKKEEQGYLAGVQFVAPEQMDSEFIKSLSIALHLA